MIVAIGFMLAAAIAAQAVPPVPGGCSEPAAGHVDQPGCWLSAELGIERPPPVLYWHIVRAGSEAEARKEAARHRWASVIRAHGAWWLYVMSADAREPGLPAHHVAGPLATAPDRPVTARFMESLFPPGMRTRVHSHSGPEVFFVIDGEQCTETPSERRTIRAGESYVVPGGPHLQGAPRGRRSVVLILAPAGEPWMRLSDEWQGTGFCNG